MATIDRPLVPHKAQLANHAVVKNHIKSFADLGGCWGVNAGYALDLLAKHKIEYAYEVDQIVTDISYERAKVFPQLKFITGLLGERKLINDFPPVDALIMYDIILHQVDLDWDTFLAAWSKKTRVFIIYNQNWKLDDHTVRFIDRGLNWYKKYVYYTNELAIDNWFRSHDLIDPKTLRQIRNQHNYWQWGITRNDMIRHIETLGFKLQFFEDYGAFQPKYPWISNQGFIFVRE